jgi:hypothetical protein
LIPYYVKVIITLLVGCGIGLFYCAYLEIKKAVRAIIEINKIRNGE